MRIVVALGGNALLRRGEPMTADNQRANIRIATEQIAKIHSGNELVIAHGNGPQVGLLSLQAAAYTSVSPYPLGVLGAEADVPVPLKETARRAQVLAEREAISRTLRRCGWNKRAAARTLKVSYKALLYKIRECEIVDPRQAHLPPPPVAGQPSAILH